MPTYVPVPSVESREIRRRHCQSNQSQVQNKKSELYKRMPVEAARILYALGSSFAVASRIVRLRRILLGFVARRQFPHGLENRYEPLKIPVVQQALESQVGDPRLVSQQGSPAVHPLIFLHCPCQSHEPKYRNDTGNNGSSEMIPVSNGSRE
jgi:hypothetical protein